MDGRAPSLASQPPVLVLLWHSPQSDFTVIKVTSRQGLFLYHGHLAQCLTWGYGMNGCRGLGDNAMEVQVIINKIR